MRNLFSPLSTRPQPRSILPTSRICPLFQQVRSSTHEQTARDLNQKGIDDQLLEFEDAKEKQNKAPWHREGVDTAPVHRERSARPMTKGMEQIFVQVELADLVKANY